MGSNPITGLQLDGQDPVEVEVNAIIDILRRSLMAQVGGSKGGLHSCGRGASFISPSQRHSSACKSFGLPTHLGLCCWR